MEYIWLVFLLISFGFLLYGLRLIFGLGWALFIVELLTQTVSTDYAAAQRDTPPSKDGHQKQAGALYIFLSIIFGLLTIYFF